MAHLSFVPTVESSDVADDIRRLFSELDAALPGDRQATTGQCRPAVDVVESEDHVEVSVDVAGVPAAALRVAFREGILLIVGEKPAPVGSPGAYHLVEREFGRFARAIQLTGAFDLSRAEAAVRNGELLIRLPKIRDRRGVTQRIPVHDSRHP